MDNIVLSMGKQFFSIGTKHCYVTKAACNATIRHSLSTKSKKRKGF